MLSIPHIIIIFLVALVVLGPDKLPQVARAMGKAMADFRRVTGDFRYQMENEMHELERQARLKELEATMAGPITPSPEPVLPAYEGAEEAAEHTIANPSQHQTDAPPDAASSQAEESPAADNEMAPVNTHNPADGQSRTN